MSTPTAGGGGDSTCGCCGGITHRTPRAAVNRPGLSTIAYRTGTHSDFLASMIAGLTDARRASLRRLTTRDVDDFSIGLLDAWAVAADVLSFYTERLAHESFLRTARDRLSLQELGRLIGYRLRPGVAAETALAFSVQAPPAPPPDAEPGSLPPVTPLAVAVPIGLRVQSIPGPGQQPQTFETVEELDARPGWGAIPASATVAGTGPTNAWLAGAGLNLKVGDVVVWTSAAHEEVRDLSAVTVDAAGARTHIRWNGALAGAAGSTPTPFVFRRQLAIFGHNAPSWKAMSQDFRDNYDEPGSTLTQWPNLDVSLASHTSIPVDGSHPDLVAGSKVLIRVGSEQAVWQVLSKSEGSRAEFAVSGRVTDLDIDGATGLGAQSRRDIVVYAGAEQLTLARRDDPSAVSGDHVEVDADVSDLAPGRRLIVTGRTTAGEDVVHSTTLTSLTAGGGRSTLHLDDGLVAALVRTTVVVHANVAMSTHGETVGELLGAGRARASHQRFTLKSEPLTWVQSSDPSGASPALEVRVNDVLWEEVPTLYGAGPHERHYVLRTDDENHNSVQFGDGEHGARLPTGHGNVRARYRKGGGAGGNVGAGQLANLLDRPLGLTGVTNPSPAAGGTDPEMAAVARRSIPLNVRTLGRAVSVLDYEDFALTFAGVVKATVVVLPLRSGPTIVVTVALGPSGTGPVGGRLDDVATALVDHGDPHVAVRVLDHIQVPFRLAMKVAVDPAFEAEAVTAGVEAAIRSTFAFSERRFGATVEQSHVIAVAHSVPGVVAVDLDRLYDGPTPSLRNRLVAPAAAVTSTGTASAAGLSVAAPSPFDWLEVMA